MSNVNLNETTPTRFQDIGGVSLAYRRFGMEGAPPVVCFQHFTGTMNNFDPIHTNRLARDRPVILVDYRGVGRAGGQMPDSMPAIAADLIAFVKALDLKEIDLFAFSIGGMIAQQFVLAAPGLVRRILLVGTGPSGGEGMQEFSREVMDIVNRPNSTIQGRTLDLFFSKSPASYAAGNAWLERIAARKLDREPETGPQVAEAQLVALAKWGVIPATDRYGDLKKIKQRTLVVNGKDDMMVPTINSYILQQHLPDARLILYPDSGHGSHFQFPECSPKGPHVSSPLLEPKGAAVSTATVCAAYSARGIDGERSAVGRARRFGDLRVSRHNGTRRRDAGRPREGPLCH